MQDIRVAELFAGVGGFRLGLEGYHDACHPEFELPSAGSFKTVWANQWEPPGTKTRQFAAQCYTRRFGEGSVVNEDIERALDEVEQGRREIPQVDMVVGGFPCQDYSAAKTLSQAGGIEGKKGVLWWQILRFLDGANARQDAPVRYLLLENVDRLLKSPATQRGRDFAIMLSCLAARGYAVEWRVINAADYGFPQQRRRTYIFAEKTDLPWDLRGRVLDTGVIAEAFPILGDVDRVHEFEVSTDATAVSESFGVGDKTSRFQNAGAMQGGRVFTARVFPDYLGECSVLGDILSPTEDVPAEFYVDEAALEQWRYLKGGKSIDRVSKEGHAYKYSEGSMAFPDLLTRPARTILTGEGGKTPSRFKHIIQVPDGRWRRLVPDELDRIQGFPKGWTAGMSDGHRAFCMGNALVVGIPHRIGTVIDRRASGRVDD